MLGLLLLLPGAPEAASLPLPAPAVGPSEETLPLLLLLLLGAAAEPSLPGSAAVLLLPLSAPLLLLLSAPLLLLPSLCWLLPPSAPLLLPSSAAAGTGKLPCDPDAPLLLLVPPPPAAPVAATLPCLPLLRRVRAAPSRGACSSRGKELLRCRSNSSAAANAFAAAARAVPLLLRPIGRRDSCTPELDLALSGCTSLEGNLAPSCTHRQHQPPWKGFEGCDQGPHPTGRQLCPLLYPQEAASAQALNGACTASITGLPALHVRDRQALSRTDLQATAATGHAAGSRQSEQGGPACSQWLLQA